jgi:hypothetical protein
MKKRHGELKLTKNTINKRFEALRARSVSVASSLLLVFFLFGTIRAQPVRISIQDGSMRVGDEIALCIEMENTVPVAGLQFDVCSDSACVEMVDIRGTERTAGWTIARRMDIDKGRARVLVYSPEGDRIAPGRGPVAKLLLWALAEGEARLELRKMILGDEYGKAVPVHAESGVVHVRSNRPPVVLAPSDTTIVAGVPFALRIAASDPDSGDVLAFGDDSDLFDITSSGWIRFTPEVDALGAHLVTITVSDGRDSTKVAFELTVKLENRAPKITALPDTVAVEGRLFALRATADDPDGDRLVYRDDAQFFDIEANSGWIRFVPEDPEVGEYDVAVWVSDGALSDTTRFHLSVLNVNDAPVIVSTPPIEATEEVLYRYQMRATDEDGDALRFGLIEGPNGMTVNPLSGFVEWTPKNEDVGSMSVALSVADADTTSIQRYDLNVANVNDPPSPFSLLSPRPESVLTALTVTLRWEKSTDVDPGDAVRYVVRWGTDERFNADTEVDTVSTAFCTIGDLPDNARIYWKVVAEDRSGARVESDPPYWPFRTDATPPSFVLGVLQNPVLTDYLDVYAVASEALRTELKLEITVGDFDPTWMPLSRIGEPGLYHTDYKLSGVGVVALSAKGIDLAGNEGSGTTRFAAKRISARSGGTITSSDGRLRAIFPPDRLERDAWVLILPAEEKTHRLRIDDWGLRIEPQQDAIWGRGAKYSLPFISGTWAIGKAYEVSSASSESKGAFELAVACVSKDMQGLDRWKMGIYRLEKSAWRYVGGRFDADGGRIRAAVDQWGTYSVRYDAERKAPLPDMAALHQNFPNPFNDEILIRYALAGLYPQRTRVTIYDVLDGEGRALGSGVYFLVLEMKGFRAVRRMVLLR